MYLFLIPLLLGFAFNLSSAFTAAYSRRLGERRGRWVTAILRNVLGIPVWAIGFALAVRTPAPELFLPNQQTTFAGWLMIVLGGGIVVVGLFSLRVIAAAPSAHNRLVESGLYAHVRNPIHSGTILEFIGLALLVPTPPMLTACILGLAWVLLQTRFDELDLLQRLPAYRDYMRRVPRFIPHRKI
jgi:protein-S-isoprenylcysteine O-methyltransferase Ste14